MSATAATRIAELSPARAARFERIPNEHRTNTEQPPNKSAPRATISNLSRQA